jgi:branched-chain amino acid aminotransferase
VVIWRDGTLVDGQPGASPRRVAWGAFTTAGCDRCEVLEWRRHSSRLASTLAVLEPEQTARLPTSAELARLLSTEGLHGPARMRVVARRTAAGNWQVEAAARPLDGGGPEALAALEVVRWPAPAPLAGHKTLARLAWDHAREQAARAGADDALIVDAAGRVLETSIANVVALVGERLVTPPAPEACLPGTMRAWVLERAGELGLTAEERHVALDELLQADEVWTTNAVQGPRRVSRVGERRWQCWPIHERLAALGVPAPGW